MIKISISKIKKWCTEKNLYKLIEATLNEDPEIRKAAILSIATLGDKACLEYIQKLYDLEKDMFVRKEILKCAKILEKSDYDSSRIKELKYSPEIIHLIPNSQGA